MQGADNACTHWGCLTIALHASGIVEAALIEYVCIRILYLMWGYCMCRYASCSVPPQFTDEEIDQQLAHSEHSRHLGVCRRPPLGICTEVCPRTSAATRAGRSSRQTLVR